MTYTVRVPGAPFTTNKHMRAQPFVRASMDADWRLLAAVYARRAGVPALPAITVTVHTELTGKRGRDVGSDSSCAKACIDGFVDAGIIPDDTPKHMRGLFLLPPVLGCKDAALVLEVEPVAA